MDAEVAAAVENNARWCDAVCRSHGLAGRWLDDVWVAPGGSPPLYPDLITLRAGVSDGDVVSCLPAEAESVKDSFACLDLVPDGFRVLFDGDWIAREAPRSAAPALDWTPVEGAAGLDDWTAAAGLTGIVRAAVLADPGVRIFAGRHSARGPIVAGAIANLTGRSVGVSNVFYDPSGTPNAWRDVAAVLAAAFPGRPIVGYQHGDQLAHALDSGFSRLHPLRVWHRGPGWRRTRTRGTLWR